jgi:hypothetical protein
LGASAASRALGASQPPASQAPRTPHPPEAPEAPQAPSDLKSAFLAQLKASKVFFYNTVVAQAYRVDVSDSRITFTFLPNQRVPKQQCEEARLWLEGIAEKVAGRKVPVTVAIADAAPAAAPAAAQRPPASSDAPRASDEELRQSALSDPTVQALLEIFPVEKTKIEEL